MEGTLVPEKCSEGAPLVCTTDPVARGCARLLSGSNCACSLVLTTSNGVTESSSDLIRLD